MPPRLSRSLTPGALAALALVLVACSAPEPAQKSGLSHESIIDGEASVPGGREDGVLALRTLLDGTELVCTASLVAPNLVMTARHCVSHLARGRFSCTVKGELVSEDPGAGELGAHLPAEELEFYGGEPPREEPLARGAFVSSTLSETICLNDIAFIELDRSLNLPPLPLRLDGRARRDERATLVGYGLDETMTTGGVLELRVQPRLRNDKLVIAEVGPALSDELVTTVAPRTIAVDGLSGCFGDSGGPLLARDSGAVLGVYSLLAGSDCLAPDGRHLFAHVPDFRALTRDAFERAGHDPLPEAVAPEGGSAGEGGTRSMPAASGEGGEAGAGAAGGPDESAGAAGEESRAAGAGGREDTGPAGAPGAGTGGVLPAPATRRPSRDGGCSLAPEPGSAPSGLLVLMGAVAALFAGRRRLRGTHSTPLF